MVAESREQLDFLAAKCRREQKLGLEVEMLDRAALDRIAPYLGPAVIGAEHCLTEGKLNPLLANAAIRRKARRRWRDPLPGDEASTCYRSVTVRGFTIRTEHASVAAGRVVIAAGAGTGPLAAQFGLHVPASTEPLHMNITEAAAPLIRHLVQHADRLITLKQLAHRHGGDRRRLAGPYRRRARAPDGRACEHDRQA